MIEVLAMHGWASDARCWDGWIPATAGPGWRWHTGERGYGDLPPRMPAWDGSLPAGTRRVVIGHSLGPHLLPPAILQKADAVVLLASFADFVPPGRAGRRCRAALAGMASSLDDPARARTMLTNFLAKASAPQDAALLPPGPADGALNPDQRARLREDLDLLGRCSGLPEGFPQDAEVLIVEAVDDGIVEPEARTQLRDMLPRADVVSLPGVGHALLCDGLIERVVEWVGARRNPPR